MWMEVLGTASASRADLEKVVPLVGSVVIVYRRDCVVTFLARA
jgi:hypothetical protein